MQANLAGFINELEDYEGAIQDSNKAIDINKNQKINLRGIKSLKNNFIYHAGTKLKKGELVSNGGRVLNITVIGNKFNIIRKKIISIIKKINWQKGFYRKDIGWRVIN